MNRIQLFVNKYFTIFVIIISFIAFYLPEYFAWITGYITILLGIIMFGMGLTMKLSDFAIVAKKPLPVGIGIAAQYVIMPLAAFIIAVFLQLPPEIAAGLVLVGACPGGTASNVMVYLGKGDVAVSIAMTSVSTMLAPIFTPLILLLLANEWLPVNAGSMFMSIIQVIIIPVGLGILVSRFFPAAVARSVRMLPVVSAAAIVAIVGGVIAANKENIVATGLLVILAVILHNGFGLFLGYIAAKATGLNETKRRAVAIEVGMQNSALGTQLAAAHFTPLAALPSAVFSMWHNISGPMLVAWWNRKDHH
ncbi:bile acid:Na+ symporter, BASS family [Alteribacillus persepolensis]|uniref:Bile acid:Na+ symporter, BASS family n=1 Tax=Alteribacillus persepolensis TaxID=568899 RepID=A0A1G8DAH3_9BACI|nr:bile acid:sodium symporter family protein [Alteribacillus persepolensis]SDH54691.1 bile acid:Na+ symporter, BASS family [Alteribacillus persepolensis]